MVQFTLPKDSKVLKGIQHPPIIQKRGCARLTFIVTILIKPAIQGSIDTRLILRP